MTFVSLVFEYAAFELHSSKEKQKRLANEKKMYVNFLCDEMKMPLQMTADALEIITSHVIDEQTSTASRKIIENIRQVVIVNYTIIDNAFRLNSLC